MADTKAEEKAGWPVQTIIGVLMTFLLSGSLAYAANSLTKSADAINDLAREVALIKLDMVYMRRDINDAVADIRDMKRGAK